MMLFRIFPIIRDVHTVCSWDEKAPAKIQKALEEVILEFTREIQAVRELERYHSL